MIDKPILAISKTHQQFLEGLNQPDALTDPGKYLGPNYQDVLNFWIYVDSLSGREKREVFDRHCDLDHAERVSANSATLKAAYENVGFESRNLAWAAALNVTGFEVFGYATLELIGSHKILGQGKTLTILPLCIRP